MDTAYTATAARKRINWGNQARWRKVENVISLNSSLLPAMIGAQNRQMFSIVLKMQSADPSLEADTLVMR